MAKTTTGISVRHGRGCPAATDHEAKCRCTPAYRAWVWDRRASRKLRRTFPTITAARAWRADALGAVRRGQLRAAAPVTIREALTAWIAGAEAGEIRNRSGDQFKPSVLRGYRQSLLNRILPELGGVKVADLRRVDVQEFADRLAADGLDPSTIRNTLMPLRALYRRAVARGDVAVSPMTQLELPAVRGSRDRIADPAEAHVLIESLPEGDRALWATAFYAGLRLGELRALRHDHDDGLDLAGGWIHVRHSWDQHAGLVAPKSRAGIRDIPVAGVLRDYLATHAVATGRVSGFVFGRTATQPFNPSSIYKRALRAWAAVAVGAFLTGRALPVRIEPIGLHECRHTAVSTWAEAGVSVKRISTWAGHSSVSFTLDRYAKVFERLEASEMAKLDDFLALANSGRRIEQLR